ncbi:MAG: zinc-binding dehydrogenase [bacterium]
MTTRSKDTMKAMVIHAPMEYGIEEKPIPDATEGSMLVKVHACGLCGSDLRTMRHGHRKVTFPWTLGHEICGEPVDFGPGYTGPWKRGERLSIGPAVYDPNDPYTVVGRPELSGEVKEIGQVWPGALAEYVLIPKAAVEMGNIERSPEGLADEHAAVVEPCSSVVHAHERARTGLGDTVLVMGAGPIGCLHVAVAKARGAHRVYISDLIPERLALAEAFEPDGTVNIDTDDVRAELLKVTGGRGPDVIVTAAPAGVAQVQAVELAAKGARIVLFGGLPKDDSKPGVDMNLVHYKNLDLIGLSIFAPRHFRTALQLIETGKIPVEKLVTHVFPLAEFNEGAQLALDGKALKVVFKP